MSGPDDRESVAPGELSELVWAVVEQMIRAASRLDGDGIKRAVRQFDVGPEESKPRPFAMWVYADIILRYALDDYFGHVPVEKELASLARSLRWDWRIISRPGDTRQLKQLFFHAAGVPLPGYKATSKQALTAAMAAGLVLRHLDREPGAYKPALARWLRTYSDKVPDLWMDGHE